MFNPTLETRLFVEDRNFTFAPHPAIPSMVWGQEGRHATVYRIVAEGESYGLKVFRPAFRHEGLITAAESLWTFHELPGMQVCKQAVITRAGYPELVDHYEDLDYAMVMPWIEGETWFDILNKRAKITLDQARALADSMAWTLYALELNQLAHCDLSNGNTIIAPQADRIHLVDVEDLYSPWLSPPPMLPAGSPGYQHREVARSGQWGPAADRFGGAVLMAEMLGWAHPDVRQSAWGESYFDPAEMQQPGERFDTLMRVLRLYHPGFAETFENVWRSEKLEDCPPIKTWYDHLDALPRDPVRQWVKISPKELGEEEDRRIFGIPIGGAKKVQDNQADPVPAQEKPAARRSWRGCVIPTFTLASLSLLCCCAASASALWMATNK
jgi:hypothetical protein